MSKDLTALLSPKSICIVGASRSPEKVGNIVLKNILSSKFSGSVYPINPNVSSLYDKTCFPDIASLPEVVDLAIVVVPAATVPESLNQIGTKGIKNVVVFSAGFKEIGPDGEKLEQSVAEIAQKYSLNIIGPNCLGFINNSLPVNATFGQPVTQTGPLRFISQSGAIASSLFDWCNSNSLGFSDFITLGNKTVLNENDILQYFLDHNPTDSPHPIGLYLESISDGQNFLRITKQLS
jgi:acetate---CoA ligase (ADP-forming)